ELPLVKRSEKRMKENGALDQMMNSSARRDRCTAQIEAVLKNSSAKSRSETESIELAVGRAKPSRLAVSARSIEKEVPASAAAPSGHSSARLRRSLIRPRSRPNIST